MFLCPVHHTEYDSRNPQARNWTAEEVRQYRSELHKSQARSRADCSVQLQFVVDREFSTNEEQQFLDSLEQTLSIDGELLLIRTEHGSTRLTVALSAEQARKTHELYEAGALKHLGVLTIRDPGFHCDAQLDDAGNWMESGSPRTRWTIVLLAAQGPLSEEARIALHELCITYHKTLYRLARHKGKDDEAARDLVQEFICSLLDSSKTLASVDPSKGRFRGYLRMRFENFMIDSHRKATAAMRGGDKKEFSIDFAMDQGHVYLEPIDGLTPDMAYRKSYALDTFQAVLDDLEAAWIAKGAYDRFCHLREYLANEVKGSKARTLAGKLNISDARARGLVAELRAEFLRMLRTRVAQTLSEPTEQDIEQELDQFWVDLNL